MHATAAMLRLLGCKHTAKSQAYYPHRAAACAFACSCPAGRRLLAPASCRLWMHPWLVPVHTATTGLNQVCAVVSVAWCWCSVCSGTIIVLGYRGGPSGVCMLPLAGFVLAFVTLYDSGHVCSGQLAANSSSSCSLHSARQQYAIPQEG